MAYQSDSGGLCRLFLNGDIFHYAAATAVAAAHPGRDEETVVLKQVLFCSGCQLSLPALSLRQPWSIFDLWLPKLFNFWRSHRCSIFLFSFFYPSTLLHPRAALWEKWIFLLVQQRVFCTRSEPGSQNVEIFVYGGTKDVCRCHWNGLGELCTGCYQDTRRVDWFSWHGGYLDSLKEARGDVLPGCSRTGMLCALVILVHSHCRFISVR